MTTPERATSDALDELISSADLHLQETVTAYEPLEAVYLHATASWGQLTEAVGTAWLPQSPTTTTASAR